jgi:hypothetical protein
MTSVLVAMLAVLGIALIAASCIGWFVPTAVSDLNDRGD